MIHSTPFKAIVLGEDNTLPNMVLLGAFSQGHFCLNCNLNILRKVFVWKIFNSTPRYQILVNLMVLRCDDGLPAIFKWVLGETKTCELIHKTSSTFLKNYFFYRSFLSPILLSFTIWSGDYSNGLKTKCRRRLQFQSNPCLSLQFDNFTLKPLVTLEHFVTI